MATIFDSFDTGTKSVFDTLEPDLNISVFDVIELQQNPPENVKPVPTETPKLSWTPPKEEPSLTTPPANEATKPESMLFRFLKKVKAMTEDTPEYQQATLQNKAALANTLKLPFEEVNKPEVYERLRKDPNITGLSPQPEFMDVANKLMQASIVPALVVNPVAAGLGIGSFMALGEIENAVTSMVQNEPYKFGAGKELANLLPAETNQYIKNVAGIGDFVAKGILAGGFTKDTLPAVDVFSKNLFEKTGLNKTFFKPYYDQIMKRIGFRNMDEMESALSTMRETAKKYPPEAPVPEPGATPAQPEMIPTEKMGIQERYNKYREQALGQGLNEQQAMNFAKTKVQEEGRVEPTATTPIKQEEFGVPGGVQGFGQGAKGVQELPITETKPIEIPEITKEDIATYKTEATQLRNDRIFEWKEINRNSPLAKMEGTPSIPAMKRSGLSGEMDALKRDVSPATWQRFTTTKDIPGGTTDTYGMPFDKWAEAMRAYDRIEKPSVKLDEYIKQAKERATTPEEYYRDQDRGYVYSAMEEGEPPPKGFAPERKSRLVGKEYPPSGAPEKIKFEQPKPWTVEHGRDIEGVFQRVIAPLLRVSKRFRTRLGAYYPDIGEWGLIKVKTLNPAQKRILFHETGHFFDELIGKYPIERTKVLRNELYELSKEVVPVGEHPSKNYLRYRRSRQELLANYIAMFVDNPELTKAKAPNFTKIMDAEYAKGKELTTIVDKLRSYKQETQPIEKFMAAVEELGKSIPEIQTEIKPFERKGIRYLLWNKTIADPIFNKIKGFIDKLSQVRFLREVFVNKGLTMPTYEVMRQRSKLISGQTMKIKQEIGEPFEKIGKEDQKAIAESLQRFGDMDKQDKWQFRDFTEKIRKEVAYWGNELRKLGLLDDSSFWNNVGQYMPFLYETKEFDALKSKYGMHPSKVISANLGMTKHKLTDYEMGIKGLEQQFGTFPSGKAKIAAFPKEDVIALGRQIREEMGLIKTAGYPMVKRLNQMIKLVYTTKMFNKMAEIPGLVGAKGMKGYGQMPEGKKYGSLSGAYVTDALLKEVNQWNNVPDDLQLAWDATISVWKSLKVPYDPNAIIRNIFTNAIISWMNDVPIYRPDVVAKGLTSFFTRDEAYKSLRDRGLYRHTYATEELERLHTMVKDEKDPANAWGTIIKWAIKTFEKPGEFYGAIEDASKTIIARYALDHGATPESAIKLADKALFDYGEISNLNKKLRKLPFPFITWTMKALPVILETMIRRPEKILLMTMGLELLNTWQRNRLGISKDEENKLTPDYLKGRSKFLQGVSKDGRMMWADLSYFMPWDNMLPIRKGGLGVPQALSMGNPLFSVYNALVANYDPYMGQIAKDYMSPEQAEDEKIKYLMRSLLPRVLVNSPGRIYKAAKKLPVDLYETTPSLTQTLMGELGGVKTVYDTQPYEEAIVNRAEMNYNIGVSKLEQQYDAGLITKKQYEKYMDSLEKHMEELFNAH